MYYIIIIGLDQACLICSPNTPGLRDWQRKEQLEELLRQVVAARNSLPGTHKPPLLVKLAPDLTSNEKKDIAQVLTKPEVVCYSIYCYIKLNYTLILFTTNLNKSFVNI